jgi:hypothetical protein
MYPVSYLSIISYHASSDVYKVYIHPAIFDRQDNTHIRVSSPSKYKTRDAASAREKKNITQYPPLCKK